MHHDSGHVHSHVHTPTYERGGSESGVLARRLIVAIALTAFISVAELAGGFLTGSLALLSDAAHVFLDVVALVASYVALRLASLPPTDRHTYGFRRAEVLAALANAITLLVVAVGIGNEALQRWWEPVQIQTTEMLAIAVIGLVANVVVALTLRGHTHGNLSARSALLHVIGDALASVGVIVAAVVMLATGWYGADPLASALIGLLITYSAIGVLREAVHILMEGAPEGMRAQEVQETMAGVDGVLGVHDIHIWSTGSSQTVLSAHVQVAEASLPKSMDLLAHLRDLLRERYGIGHATLQVECADCGQSCVDVCAKVAAATEDARE